MQLLTDHLYYSHCFLHFKFIAIHIMLSQNIPRHMTANIAMKPDSKWAKQLPNESDKSQTTAYLFH